MKNLLTRSLTGFTFVTVILGSLLLGEIAYSIVFAAITIGAFIEYYSFFKAGQYHPNKVIGYICGLLVFAIFFFTSANYIPVEWAFAIFPFLLLIFIFELYAKNATPLENVAITIFPILYIAAPIGLINILVFPAFEDNRMFTPDLLIAVLVLIWIYDSAAYMFGVTLGKHRLFERISPKKSWEGAIGGAITTIAASYVVSTFIPEISITHWAILAGLIVVTATFGDLTESLIKRTFGVKDSSNLFPGHGGILDRFDSLFFVIPVVVLYLKLVIEY